MSTTFVASFFLPYTVDFHNIPRPPSRAPSVPRLRLSRSSLLNDKLPSFSLLTGSSTTPPTTPAASTNVEQFFSQWQPAVPTPARKPGDDPRSALTHTDSHIDDWGGSSRVFRQPRSLAGPPIQENILNFSNTRPPQENHSQHSHPQSVNPDEFETWTIEQAVQGNGGLANAVRATQHGDCPENIVWVGTLGCPTDALSDEKKREIHDKLEHDFDALTVYSTDANLDGHYARYCKTILWPVFHYQIPDHPKSKAYEDHSWKFYVRINEVFADRICANHKRGDTIWIHDYHLLLVPALIRKKIADARIGFFLHTAFPSAEVFRCLSSREQLLEGMLGSNLVAFQTMEYAQHFLETCSRLLIVESTTNGVQLEDRFVNVTNLAMGIDPRGLSLARADPEVTEWIHNIQSRYHGKKLIVARDKLDNVRGVRQKLLAFELFLNQQPEWRNKVVLLQVATSTTEHTELLATVADIVTRIESVHSSLAHQPLVFLKQDIGFSQYLALLAVADAFMITSLREGMNLTGHEYIFCQDGEISSQKHGPLILSEFTGSAAVLGPSPLSVNPWDYRKCADAILEALTMSDEEKQRRHAELYRIVTTHTGAFWFMTLQQQLVQYHEEHSRRNSMSIPRLSIETLVEQYRASHRRLFLLDYEATLASSRTSSGGGGTSTTSRKTGAIPSPSFKRIVDTLNVLVSDPKNIVYILSRQTPEELEHIFARNCSTVGLIGENGCFLKPFNSDTHSDDEESEWRVFPSLTAMREWKTAVRTILQYYLDRVEGSFIEERHCSLIFRYPSPDPDPNPTKSPTVGSTARLASECATHINESCASQRIHAVNLPGENSVLIEPVDWTKTTAAQHIFNALRHGRGRSSSSPLPGNAAGGRSGTPTFIFVAGTSTRESDCEGVFRWANHLSVQKIVPHVTTAVVKGGGGATRNATGEATGRNTEASCALSGGRVGLLSVLRRLSRS